MGIYRNQNFVKSSPGLALRSQQGGCCWPGTVRQKVVWVGVVQLLPAASHGSHGSRSTSTCLHPSVSSLGSSLTSRICLPDRIFTVSFLVLLFSLQDLSFSVMLLCGALFFPGCLSPALPHPSGLCAVTQHVISSKLVLVLYLLINERI